MLKISKSQNVDLTGDSQHGFKKNRSTVTAALKLQFTIARALDDKKYFVLTSIDLSAAFNVVNRNLLHKRLEIFGLPDVILCTCSPRSRDTGSKYV